MIETFQNYTGRILRRQPTNTTPISQDTNYIRRDRIAKDVQWKTATEYGELDITTNLSKPEKDPIAIAAAKNLLSSTYSQCQLCAENEGYVGRVNHPVWQNHRMVPITINGSPWFFQYFPYVYDNKHCICLNSQHIPMKIDRPASANCWILWGSSCTTSQDPTQNCPSWEIPFWPTTTSRVDGTYSLWRMPRLRQRSTFRALKMWRRES